MFYWIKVYLRNAKDDAHLARLLAYYEPRAASFKASLDAVRQDGDRRGYWGEQA
jgi:hypothetical protein